MSVQLKIPEEFSLGQYKPQIIPLDLRNQNSQIFNNSLHYLSKFAQTILMKPVSDAGELAFRSIKLVTYVPAKYIYYKASSRATEAATYIEDEYLNTVKALRDLLFIPSVAKRAFQDMFTKKEAGVLDDIPSMSKEDYLASNITYSTWPGQFSSYLHGCKSFQLIRPDLIEEFPATSDGTLKTVLASNFLKEDVMALNFGVPNVATLVTEKKDGNEIEVMKVDAKSLKREPMTFHPTNGKVQSGVFFIPTNLPKEALTRFKEAAIKMANAKTSHITCANTNCRILKEAGFSIQGVDMDGVILPTTMMEHLLFREVFYTDSNGKKHKVHFDIIKTTDETLEQFFERVDTAIVGTRLRHRRRNSDTEENKLVRSKLAEEIIKRQSERIKREKELLDAGDTPPSMKSKDHKQHKLTLSVPSCLGNFVASIWGRHTIYEVDLSDKKEDIKKAFDAFCKATNEKEKISPFPQTKPSFSTRVKRDILFSGPAIRFLHKHMMGRADEIYLYTQDLLKYLESTTEVDKDGKRNCLNFVLLDDKVVFSKVHVNNNSKDRTKILSDWALSKHALIAERKDVLCSGEIWYDKKEKCFKMNNDSGTYEPSFERLQVTVNLARQIFGTNNFVAVRKE